MAKKDIVGTVEQIATPIVEQHGFELVEVEYVKEGKNWFLRIYIDKPGGVGLDDCQIISEEVGKGIDEIDLFIQSYSFEVSSPGLERPLKKDSDFEKYKGTEVEVKLFEPLNGKKVFSGILQGLLDGYVVICEANTKLEFEKEKVALVKRVVKF